MDNLSAHKVAGIRELIEGRGARLIYLPPYSPDLNPFEKAWFKFKQFLRTAKTRTQPIVFPIVKYLVPSQTRKARQTGRKYYDSDNRMHAGRGYACKFQ